MIKEITPNGSIWQWKYDDRGNMIKKIYSDGSIWQYEYDDHGNMIKQIDPDGKIWQWEFTHDTSGMLTEIKENGKIILGIKLK